MYQTYLIAADLRRCCWYGIIAAIVIGPLAALAAVLEGRFETLTSAVLPPLTAAVAVAAYGSAGLYWRIEVAENGLVRRRWLGQDLWTWDEFVGGRIRKGPVFLLSDATRPWWRRKLDIGLLDREDRRRVMDAINAHYPLPPAPALPESAKIRYRLNREATFDAAGIRHTAAGATHVYGWDAVRRVLIERHDALRRDFRTLDLELADPPATIELWNYGANPNWRGATAEELNEFVFRHVPAEKIEVAIDGDYVASPGLAEKRLARLWKRDRELRWLLPMWSGLAVVAMTILIVGDGLAIWKAVVAGGLCLALSTAMHIFLKRDVRLQINRFETR